MTRHKGNYYIDRAPSISPQKHRGWIRAIFVIAAFMTTTTALISRHPPIYDGSIEEGKNPINSRFPPTEQCAEAPNRNIPKQYETTGYREAVLETAKPASKAAAIPEEEQPPLPEATPEQLSKGYKDAKAALNSGGIKVVPKISWAAERAQYNFLTYLGLLISEAALRDVKNKHTSANGLTQGTENYIIDVMKQRGRVCLPDIREKAPWAAAVMENYILPNIYQSADIKKGEEKFLKAALKAAGAPDLPGLDTKASKKKREATKKREELLNRWARKNLGLKKFPSLQELIFLVYKNPNVALRLTAEHRAKRKDILKEYIEGKNPNGRAARLMADPRYGDDFLSKLDHNLGPAAAARICGLPYDSPLTDTFTPETIAANGWSKIPTTGKLIDAKAVEFFCLKNGIIAYFTPDYAAYFPDIKKIVETAAEKQQVRRQSTTNNKVPRQGKAPSQG